MGLLDLLKAEDVQGFNANRGERRKVDLFAEELDGLKLHGVDLHGVHLDKADLTGSDLTDANIVQAFMSDIDGTGLILDGAIGFGVRMRDAWLEDADLTAADLSKGDLSGAVLKKTKGEGIRLLGAKLKEAEAQGCSWPLADLSEASLKRSNFDGADLKRVKMTDAKASGGSFVGTRFDLIDGARVRFAGANLEGAVLAGGRLAAASFREANLKGADLSNADLSNADLAGADLTGADLSNANLADASLEGAILEGAKLEGADMSGVDAQALSLDSDTLGSLADFGARYDPEAPLVFDDVTVATRPGAVLVFWQNPDSMDEATLRWGLKAEGKKSRYGVLPVNASSVLAHQALAGDDGFVLLLLVERPGGVVVMRFDVDLEGQVSAGRSFPLGYEPAVLPVFERIGSTMVMWGLARRGPTLVMHGDRGEGEGFELLSSTPCPTARGFVGRHAPILSNKGGVLSGVSPAGIGSPLPIPEGFGGRLATATVIGDRILAVWNTMARLRDPGGLRSTWIGGGDPVVDELTRFPDVNALDLIAHGDGAHMIWIEDEGPEGTHLMARHLPGGETQALDLGGEEPEEVSFARTLPGADPVVCATSLQGNLHVFDHEGRLVVKFSNLER